jgi:O-antigen/teichoic acid export membrane protein
MLRNKLLRGGTWLTAGNGIAALAGFLRNIIIARLVSVDDFGVVVLLSMTVSIMETISNLAIDRLLIQAPDGDDPELLANAHALQVTRGMLGAIVLFLVAPWLAQWFKVPQAVWAFQCVALVPLLRSLVHLDTVRFQRELRYQPTFWTEALPQVVSLGIAIPLALWLRDYAAIVWATLVQAAVQVATTHFLASRPYRLAWEGAMVRRILAFGWPLLANGLLMFVILQGDKALVAVAFDPHVVGWFGAAFMLSMAPAMVVTSVMQGLFLPVLARSRDQPVAFFQRNQQVVQGSLLVGLLVAVAFAVFGPEILVALFGERYREGVVVATLFGLTQGVRIAKTGQFVTALALARTKVPLTANLARGLALLAAVVLVAAGSGPVTVAASGLLGEIVSYMIGAHLLARQTQSPLLRLLPQFLLWTLLTALSWGLGLWLRDSLAIHLHFLIGLPWILATVVFYAWTSPAVRAELVRIIKGNHHAG